MITTTFSALRNNVKKYFDKVELGETVEIYRHGKPVAILAPISPQKDMSASRWQISAPLKIKGLSLSQIILDERRCENFGVDGVAGVRRP